MYSKIALPLTTSLFEQSKVADYYLNNVVTSKTTPPPHVLVSFVPFVSFLRAMD
jgi:hypothetical protein